jgi:hypothetical protein
LIWRSVAFGVARLGAWPGGRLLRAVACRSVAGHLTRGALSRLTLDARALTCRALTWAGSTEHVTGPPLADSWPARC